MSKIPEYFEVANSKFRVSKGTFVELLCVWNKCMFATCFFFPLLFHNCEGMNKHPR